MWVGPGQQVLPRAHPDMRKCGRGHNKWEELVAENTSLMEKRVIKHVKQRPLLLLASRVVVSGQRYVWG